MNDVERVIEAIEALRDSLANLDTYLGELSLSLENFNN